MLDALARVAPVGGTGLSDLLDLPGCRRFAAGLRVVVATDLAAAGLGTWPPEGGKERFVVRWVAAFDPAGTATARQPPTRFPGRKADRQARGMLSVSRETPLHLGLATYDHFDGADSEEEKPCGQHRPLELIPKAGAWLRLDALTAMPTGSALDHQSKVGTLDSGVLPFPPQTTRFCVGIVNRPEFSGWAQARLIRSVGRTAPMGTVIDTKSTPTDPDHLRSLGFGKPARDAIALNLADLGVPRTFALGEAPLVRLWARGTSQRSSQVEAVVAGLRGHCLHDRAASIAKSRGDIVGRFLLGNRCGPDYRGVILTLALLGRRSLLDFASILGRFARDVEPFRWATLGALGVACRVTDRLDLPTRTGLAAKSPVARCGIGRPPSWSLPIGSARAHQDRKDDGPPGWQTLWHR